MHYRLLELGATFFHFTLDTMLWEMTMAQLLSLVETKNYRDWRTQQESERRQKMSEQGFSMPPAGKREPPKVSDIERVFGSSLM